LIRSNEVAWVHFVGNSSPVAITLGDIVPVNFSGDFGDTAQFFSAGGTVVATVTYYDGYGWCDASSFEVLDTMVLDPGVAFFASCSQSGVSFTCPAVL
jgi:hypothetical protein